MTAAALMLATALIFGPTRSRRQAQLLATLPRCRPGFTATPLAVSGCAALVLLMPWPAAVGISLLIGTLAMRHRRAARRRLRTEEASALRCALDVLISDLRVGAHPVAAIGNAAREAEGRVGEALSTVAARAVLGADVPAGLCAEAQRSTASEHWQRLAVCWRLADSHGLGIATLMQAARHDIVERDRHRGRVIAALAGARATAAILAGLPLLGLLLGQSIGADPVELLFSDGTGGWLFLVGTGFVCCGLMWSDAIIAKATT
ncbi:MAG: type II secretion system F family protein [Mycolicibacterium sp.]|uniref:type II secretion system F family protein n=1 Tax=Mycolicibacterium sp. TaxID=2320850 RepID=UPI003D0B6533